MYHSKDVQCLNEKKRKIHAYAAYKRLILELHTHRLKVKEGKIYSVQMKMEQKHQSIYTHIRQNRLKKTSVIKDKEGHYIKIKESIQ